MNRSYRVLLSDFECPDISGGLPLLFSKAGCTVEAYCADRSWLRKSTRLTAWHPASGTDPAAYARGLASLVATKRYDWVVLAEDQALRIARDHLDPVHFAGVFPVCDPANARFLGSKAGLARLCSERAIPAPRSAIIGRPEDAARSARDIGYPLLAKVDESGGGLGVFLCADEISLASALSGIAAEKASNLVLQQFIPGADVMVDALYREGTLLAAACSRVRSAVDGAFSVSSVREYEPHARAYEFARFSGERLGLDGFCNMTLREDRCGALHLIEADMRPNAWFRMGECAGVDFALAIERYLSDGEPLAAATKRIVARHFFRDANASLVQGDYRNIIAWIVNADGRWRFLPWGDPRYLASLAGQLLRARKAAFGARHPRLRAAKRWPARPWRAARQSRPA